MNMRIFLVVISVVILAALCTFVAYQPPVMHEEEEEHINVTPSPAILEVNIHNVTIHTGPSLTDIIKKWWRNIGSIYTKKHKYNGEEQIYPGAPGDSWCNTSFAKRMDINVNNTGGSALTDYQILVDLSSNPINEASLRVYNKTDCTLRPHWRENIMSGNCTKLWVNYSAITASSWTNNTAIYYDNVAVSSASNITNTFLFGDDFEGVAGTTAKYLTGWTKSSSNPLKDIGASQGWFAAVYNDYDDKFYLYIQDETYLNGRNTFQCYSFLKADAETPANWTDHGTIYTASQSWENGWIEPHSVLWETQSMADAREGVGVGEGTRKWRIYYCAKPSGSSNYGTGFAVASETNMTNLTAYSGNPVYPHDASYTYPDSKAVVYNNEVWILIGRYTGANPVNAFFTHSTNGIDNWTNVSTNYDTDWLLGTLHVLNGGMNVYKANDATMEAGFSTDGTSIFEYIGNPTLTGTESWEDVIGWLSVSQTKDGSCLIDSYYYLWYWGVASSVHKLCLAKTQTVTEETSYSLDTDKWNVSGVTTPISNGIVCLNGGGGQNDAGIYSKTYSHSASGAVIEWKGKVTEDVDAARGIGSGVDTTNLYKGTGGFGYYAATKDLKVFNYAGSSATTSATITLDTWYRMQNELQSSKIKVNRLEDDISVEIANTLASHPVSIYAGRGMCLDFFAVRKYATPEPSTTLGSEEQFTATTPVISSVTNGSISATSQWIDWDVNQTTHNRVVYDKGSAGADSTDCEGQWSTTHACANASDGNWSSYAESAGALLAYAYFNYTVPTGASQVESLWRVKDSPGQANLTIPSACWGNTLYLRAMGSDIGNSITWQCDNGPGWTTLHTSVANIAYEQEMKFKYVSSWDNSTAAPNITLSGLIASTLYEYQVWSYNTSNTSLSDNSSTLDFTTAAAAPILTIGYTGGSISIDWGIDWNSNITANVTNATATGVWMNFSHSEYTNTSLGDLYIGTDEWVNETHNVDAPETPDGHHVAVYLTCINEGATNDSINIPYEINRRDNTATMDSDATQNVNVLETFYINATCNEEYGDTFLGGARLKEDGFVIDTDTSVTNYVNFSHNESSTGVYNYTIQFYNATHYNDADTPTYSVVTVSHNVITVIAGNRALFCNWSANTTFANIAVNLTNCTDFFCYNSSSQKWIFYNVNRTINANTVIHKHAAIFVCFNNTTTVECNVLTAETITIPSNAWYYTALRESASKTLTEINTAITADGCTINDLYAWNSTAGAYTNTGSYNVLPNEGFAIYATTGCPWDGSI